MLPAGRAFLRTGAGAPAWDLRAAEKAEGQVQSRADDLHYLCPFHLANLAAASHDGALSTLGQVDTVVIDGLSRPLDSATCESLGWVIGGYGRWGMPLRTFRKLRRIRAANRRLVLR
jgi:hypothetical protein